MQSAIVTGQSSIARLVLRVLGVLLVSVFTIAGVWVAMPLPATLLQPARQQSLTLEDRHGALLRSTRAGDGSLARWVSLSEIDPDISRAFVAIEDRRFYQHYGIDPRAVLRAARDNALRRRVVSGASTITMQLARLLRPMGRGWTDKLRQSLWALRLEAHLTKSQILEQYLNRVPLGQGAIGVDAAMRLYFGAAPTEASLGQAALLAGLARAPSGHNPLVDPAGAAARRRLGLQRLRAQGYVTADEVSRADQEPLLGQGRGRPFLAPHFTSQLLAQAEADGKALSGSWRTSLDLALQTELEAEVRHTVEQLQDRGVRHAALVVLDNPTGEVLAWVGSPDFWSATAGQVDMVVSPRQPGSALKPFVYALAFDRGVTAATVLADVARTYQTAGGAYHPRNYDRRYHGPVRAREALASSYNVPAVELTDRMGYATLLNGLRQAGFASLRRSPEFYGLGLALGNGDVTLLELANGYRALVNGGRWSTTRDLVSADPRASQTGDGPERQVVSPRAAALVLDVLADPVARVPGFGLRTPFDWPFRAAAKTGTSRHFTDNWAVATTEKFTVAVWAGNFSGRPMEGVSGVSGAGPLLHRAVLVTSRRFPPGDLARPENLALIPAAICRVSGLRAGPHCPTMTEFFLPGSQPSATCHWHADGEVHLPGEYSEWVASGQSDAAVAGSGRATVNGEPAIRPVSRQGEPAPRLTITSPEDGDRYQIPPGIDPRYATIALRAHGGRTGAPMRWYVDDQPVTGERWTLRRGSHRLRVVAGRESAEAGIVVEGQ